MTQITDYIEKHFLLVILFFALLGYISPGSFVGLRSSIPVLLGVIMLGMGLTIQFSDLYNLRKHPKWIVLGIALQFIVMPLFAYGIGKLLQFPDELLLGLIIVGSCPGGTASNVMVYLAKAHVPLSVAMTLISTLLAPILTPMWIYYLGGESIDISFVPLLKTTFWIVIFPLLDGLILRQLVPQKKIEPVISIFPAISIISIALIISCVVGLNYETLQSFPAILIIGVILHNTLGFISGYGISKLLRFPKEICKTIAFEVGMQNSGLGVSLALIHFTKLVALPSVLFSIWHNIAGVVTVKVFRKNPTSVLKY